MKDTPIVVQLKKLINQHDVISFDIFDTLLLRPYWEPIDLFEHLAQLKQAPLFKKKRIEAEINARKKNNEQEDITIDDIYEEIDDEYKYLKNDELDLELQILMQNPEMFKAYDYAIKKEKKILFISDMYLHPETLQKSLEKNGYTTFDHLYVSSSSKKGKYTGNLYKQVLKEQQLNPSKVLHIGDNYFSDYEQANKHGITGFHYPKVMDRFIELCNTKQDFKILKFISIYNSPGASTLIMLMAMDFVLNNKSWEDNYWELIGKYYGGPLAYIYSFHINEITKHEKIDEVAFVARDGYSLKNVFDLIKDKSTKSHYIYAPRIFTKISSLAIKSLDNEYQKEDQQAKDFSFSEYNKIRNYFNSFNLGDRFILVDSITGAFSSQKLFEKVFPKKDVLGCYWHVLEYAYFLKQNFKHKTFITEKSENIKYWDIFEFFITAPEPPIKSMTQEGAPVYAEENEYEKKRIDLYKKIEPAIVSFTKDLLYNFKGIPVFFDKRDITNLIDLFCTYPTKIDKKKFTGVYISRDSDNKTYTPIMYASPTDKVVADSCGFTIPPWNINPISKKIDLSESQYAEITKQRGIPFFANYSKLKTNQYKVKKIVILGLTVFRKEFFLEKKKIQVCYLTIYNKTKKSNNF